MEPLSWFYLRQEPYPLQQGKKRFFWLVKQFLLCQWQWPWYTHYDSNDHVCIAAALSQASLLHSINSRIIPKYTSCTGIATIMTNSKIKSIWSYGPKKTVWFDLTIIIEKFIHSIKNFLQEETTYVFKQHNWVYTNSNFASTYIVLWNNFCRRSSVTKKEP